MPLIALVQYLGYDGPEAKSAAPVGSSCQSRLRSSARLINQNRAVLASAPLGSAPEIDSASLRSLPRQL
jgi:hypothetical protein